MQDAIEGVPRRDPNRTYKDTVDQSLLTEKGKALIALEQNVPVLTERDASLRIKVIDKCGHACTFCHNEGTLVNTPQSRDRVSVFLQSGSYEGFQAGKIEARDNYFRQEIQKAIDQLGIKEVHLTGGEPTQHENLPELVGFLSSMGLIVKMTTNGETGKGKYAELARAGLQSISVSIFGSTEEEYAATQPANGTRYGRRWAQHKLSQSRLAISEAKANGIEVKANCVMSDASHEDRIKRLIKRAYNEGFSLRILNDLGNGQESIASIYNLLADLGAEPISRKVVAGVSGSVSYFRLPNGQEIGFKQIREVRLDHVCNGCHLDKENRCEEGYYGIRLYKKENVPQGQNPYIYGVCIQRMDLAVGSDQFWNRGYPEAILNLTEEDYASLTQSN
jgi:cyclic pyranopterin phosphate synthase